MSMQELKFLDHLDEYGRMGVEALKAATPKDTGKTSESWEYRIVRKGNRYGTRVAIEWHNTNVVKDYANIAILLQYGHATGTGGWVVGIDYINPAIEPIFKEISDAVSMEVDRL